MGVPRLFGYITRKYHGQTIQTQQGERMPIKVNNLYLDANGLLHTAAQKVYSYGNFERKDGRASYPFIRGKEKWVAVFDIFFRSILDVLKVVKPDNVLFIAIDGPAPLAKQAQQRQRRFLGHASSEAPAEAKVERWLIANITPGTEFMSELYLYINYAIRQEMNRFGSDLTTTRVIFSPPSVPGEGEHKILNWIRALPAEHKGPDTTHCIYGLDGDLIMLALATHLPRVYLCREDQYNLGGYHIMDMSTIAARIPTETFPGRRAGSARDLVDDFILIGFFVGNDFLPRIRMFLMLEDGLDLMLGIYARHASDPPLTKDGKLNWAGFATFVKRISADENRYLLEQAKVEMPEERFVNTSLLESIRDGRLDMDAYRIKYYSRCLGIEWDGVDMTPVHKVCEEYVRSTEWVLEYYLHGIPSWEYYYKYHYAPLMSDLATYLERERPLTVFDMGEPSLPFVQLLSVLPARSAIELLPAEYAELSTDPTSPLVKAGYYPKEVHVDYEGVMKEHMGVVHLPFVDVKLIRKAYEGVIPRTPGTSERNFFGRPEIYVYDPWYLGKYCNKYGSVATLKVRHFSMDTIPLIKVSGPDRGLPKDFPKLKAGDIVAVAGADPMCIVYAIMIKARYPLCQVIGIAPSAQIESLYKINAPTLRVVKLWDGSAPDVFVSSSDIRSTLGAETVIRV